jgi:Flp pilus assembly pilin Flp
MLSVYRFTWTLAGRLRQHWGLTMSKLVLRFLKKKGSTATTIEYGLVTIVIWVALNMVLNNVATQLN